MEEKHRLLKKITDEMGAGSALLASMVSSLPAWMSFDPLPVLDNFGTKMDSQRHDREQPADPWDELTTAGAER